MKFIILQILIAVTVLVYQTVTAPAADYAYLVGWLGLIVTLLVGFAKIVSQNAAQKKDIEALQTSVKEVSRNQKVMAGKIQGIEIKIAKGTR